MGDVFICEDSFGECIDAWQEYDSMFDLSVFDGDVDVAVVKWIMWIVTVTVHVVTHGILIGRMDRLGHFLNVLRCRMDKVHDDGRTICVIPDVIHGIPKDLVLTVRIVDSFRPLSMMVVCGRP